MNLETYAQALVARFAIEEGARHGGINNMLAVAMVLRNRVMAGWGDWLEVAESAPSRRGTEKAPQRADTTNSSIRAFLGRMDGIWRGDEEDLTGGALFYIEPGMGPLAGWFETEVLGEPEEHPRTAHIGPVWFFK